MSSRECLQTFQRNLLSPIINVTFLNTANTIISYYTRLHSVSSTHILFLSPVFQRCSCFPVSFSITLLCKYLFYSKRAEFPPHCSVLHFTILTTVIKAIIIIIRVIINNYFKNFKKQPSKTLMMMNVN